MIAASVWLVLSALWVGVGPFVAAAAAWVGFLLGGYFDDSLTAGVVLAVVGFLVVGLGPIALLAALDGQI